MENAYQSPSYQKDILTEPKKLPGMLNVLTILTYIGCALAYITLIINYFTWSNYERQYAQMEEMKDQIADNDLASNIMQGSLEVMQKSYENRYILLVSGLLFTTMCLIGALQMRKLKKTGFLIYTIGELAPVILSGALIGFSPVGGLTTIITAIFALLFVILYSTQRKYLVN